MGKPPAFQLYAADFYMDTASWSATQVGVYFRLLMWSWINGPLPNDYNALARISGIDPGNFQKCYVPTIGRKFMSTPSGELVNKRLEECRVKQAEFQKNQSVKGKKSADVRWAEHKAAVKYGLAPEHKPDCNSSSSSSNKELKKQETPVDNSKEPDKELQAVMDKVLTCYPRFNGLFNFVQTHKDKNRKALVYTLQRLIDEHTAGRPVLSPYPYCERIISVENGNFNERDHDAMAQQYKIKPGEAQSIGSIMSALMQPQGKGG